MVAVIAILVWLGSWQLNRLTWKENLIAQVEARVGLSPQPIPAPHTWDQMIPEDYNFTPSTARGTYQFDYEAYVFTTLHTPRGTSGGQGVWVMTPLLLEDGHLIYINRGFVPYETWLDGTQTWDPPADTVTVTGLLRRPELQDFFATDPDLTTRLFNRRDTRFIARQLQMNEEKVSQLALFYLDTAANSTGRLPQGGETEQTFSNSHLQYMVTWYGLALAVLGSLIYWLSLQLRSTRPETQS